MQARHPVGPIHVGQGAGDAQYPVIAPGRQAQARRRVHQQLAPGVVGPGDLVQQFAIGLGVGADPRGLFPFVTVSLNRAGLGDPGRDLGGALAGRGQVEG